MFLKSNAAAFEAEQQLCVFVTLTQQRQGAFHSTLKRREGTLRLGVALRLIYSLPQGIRLPATGN